MEKIDEQKRQSTNLFEITINLMHKNIIELSKKYLEEIFKEDSLYRDYFEEIFGYEYETIDKNFNLDSLMKLYILSNGGFSLAYVYNNDNFTTIKENLIRDISSKDIEEFEKNAMELFRILNINKSKDLKKLIKVIKEDFESKINIK